MKTEMWSKWTGPPRDVTQFVRMQNHFHLQKAQDKDVGQMPQETSDISTH